MSCLINTFGADFRKAYATDATSTSFASTAPTTTSPFSNDGVVDMRAGNDRMVSNMAFMMPYGSGADDDTFAFRVWGWRLIGTLYVPSLLIAGSCTISTCVGIAGATVTSDSRFADTIAISYPTDGENVSYQLNSPADDSLANIAGHVVFDLKGHRYIQVDFDRTGTTTACNALLAGY